jgi:phosphoglycolate phosphatase
MKTPALIFDLDGTLVDTASDLLGALNAVLVEEGRRTVNMTDLRHLVGHGASAMLAEAFIRTGDPVSPECLPLLVKAFIAHYLEHIADESRPFSGVPETLNLLKRGGARLGVLTNKPQELTVPLLEALDLAPFFAAIQGAGRYSYTKPDPRVLHHVIDELGGPGLGAVMIGDSITDVATARAAQIPVILLAYGYSPEPAEALGAEMVLDDFRQLPVAVLDVLLPGSGPPSL